MITIQIPPSGVAATFPVEIPRPGNLETLGGVRVYCMFALARPDLFTPGLTIGGVERNLPVSATGPSALTFVAHLQEPVDAPAQVEISINEANSLEPGNTVTIYAWGAQTESGQGALNPDEGGQPSTMTETIEVGVVEVVTWQEWNRMTGGNQGS